MQSVSFLLELLDTYCMRYFHRNLGDTLSIYTIQTTQKGWSVKFYVVCP